jgi:hypothetical protein
MHNRNIDGMHLGEFGPNIRLRYDRHDAKWVVSVCSIME